MKFEGDWSFPGHGFVVEVMPRGKKGVSESKNRTLIAYFLHMLMRCRHPEQFLRDLMERMALEKRAQLLDSKKAKDWLKNGKPRKAFSEEIQYLAKDKYKVSAWMQPLGWDAHLSAETIRKIYNLGTFFPERESIYVILLALGKKHIGSVEKAELLFQLSGFSRCKDPGARVENIVFDCFERGMTVDDCFERLKKEKCSAYLTRILRQDDVRVESGKHRKSNHRL